MAMYESMGYVAEEWNFASFEQTRDKPLPPYAVCKQLGWSTQQQLPYHVYISKLRNYPSRTIYDAYCVYALVPVWLGLKQSVGWPDHIFL